MNGVWVILVGAGFCPRRTTKKPESERAKMRWDWVGNAIVNFCDLVDICTAVP